MTQTREQQIESIQKALDARGRGSQIVQLHPEQGTEQLVVISGKCILSGKPVETKPLPIDGVLAWLGGATIQNALPRASEDDREFLISGCGGEAFDAEFGEKHDQTIRKFHRAVGTFGYLYQSVCSCGHLGEERDMYEKAETDLTAHANEVRDGEATT